jgi:predicted nucleic acid-binding protein
MGFLIDTCIWIAVERGTLSPAEVAAVTGSAPVCISPITIAELKYGAEIAPRPDIRQKRLAALQRLKRKPMLRIDEVTGDIFGGLAVPLKTIGRGHDCRIQDLWPASQAIQHGLKLLTYNRKDFADIPGLDLAILPKPREESTGM